MFDFTFFLTDSHAIMLALALIAALAALGLVGFAAWMMYSDWAVATVS